MKTLSIDKNRYEINGFGFDPNTDYRYISLSCYDGPEVKDVKFIEIPIPITLDEKWFEKIQDYNKDLEKESDILLNLNEKLASGYYNDKINIDGENLKFMKKLKNI